VAHGRPDFWLAQIPGMNIYGSGQTAWYAVEMGTVPAGSADDFIEYVVPEDTILHLTAGLICCDAPGIQKCALNFSPALLGNVYYDLLFSLPLHPSGTYEIPAGSTVYVRVYNLDDEDHEFTVSLVGFEEHGL